MQPGIQAFTVRGGATVERTPAFSHLRMRKGNNLHCSIYYVKEAAKETLPRVSTLLSCKLACHWRPGQQVQLATRFVQARGLLIFITQLHTCCVAQVLWLNSAAENTYLNKTPAICLRMGLLSTCLPAQTHGLYYNGEFFRFTHSKVEKNCNNCSVVLILLFFASVLQKALC